MALAKVTIEALTQMANTLRQSADDILLTKEQMDRELYSIPWDDPIGLNFINRYEEDFMPLKEKLIPDIKSYLNYLENIGITVGEYAEMSHIHITGTEDIVRVLPKGTPVDPVVLDHGTVPRIPNDPLQPINPDSVIPATEEYSGTWKLQPDEQIALDDRTVIEITPIPNGCGTTEGIGHWAGQTGAGVDAFMNYSPVAKGAALVGIATGGVAGIIAISAAGKILNPEEFQRLNDEACAMHDICYVQGDKFVCEQNLHNDGGRFMSIGTSLFGGPAYKEAQIEGLNSQMYIKKAEIMSGKRIILPEGYWARLSS
ncbi:MAG: hypothetical protein IJG41_10125, partial [Bacteroidales bacterium]|nr:hypothetical protein [Bacteroidales bacterium]